VLRRARFGRSSEKLDAQVEQLELLIGDIEETDAEFEARAEASNASPPTSAKPRKPSGHARLPEHLPLEAIVHEAPCICPACGGGKFSKVGADEREVLEYIPAHFKRVLHIRPKMSCRACETLVQAPMPSLPIEKGRPGPALLAHVIVSKFCDHLPLHRQSDIYARSGVVIDRSTMAGWAELTKGSGWRSQLECSAEGGFMAAYLEHVGAAIGRHVRAGASTHATAKFLHE
jgi:transposase